MTAQHEADALSREEVLLLIRAMLALSYLDTDQLILLSQLTKHPKRVPSAFST